MIGATGEGLPVTAKLSKRFYEVLGEEIATELVTWFNDVDATYRTDLRELNELNFGRFDAKLEQRLADLDAKWGTRWTELDAKLERRLAELDAKWSTRWTELDARWVGRWTTLDAKLDRSLAQMRADLIKWMFAFWAPTTLAIIGMGITLVVRR